MRETIHRLLRSQMVLKGVDYNDLSHRLADIGVKQSAANLRSKVNHGTLGAQLFVFIQIALGVNALEVTDIKRLYRDVDEDLRQKGTTDVSHETDLTAAVIPSPYPVETAVD